MKAVWAISGRSPWRAAGIVLIIVAVIRVVVLPLVLKFVGLPTTTERLLAILRWPILFATIAASVAFI
jgi:membrane protein